MRAWSALFWFVTFAGCGGDGDIGPTTPVKVMTRNVYLGGDLAVVLSRTVKPEDIPVQAAVLWDTMQKSDFPARAKLIADEIVAAAPDLIGLQEIERIYSQTPSDYASNPQLNASKLELDFLQLILDELKARGRTYQVGVDAVHSNVELPANSPEGGLMDLRLTDSDVILVREGIDLSNPRQMNFANYVGITLVGVVRIELKRGYGSIEATVNGARLTFANTHLEVGGQLGAFQEAQADELVRNMGKVSGPLVLLGDFNSAADGSSTQSYAKLMAKFSDVWSKVNEGDLGLTCCSDLTSPTFTAGSRIDLVLYRGPIRPESAVVIGTDPTNRTGGGLWPSDHAAVVATVGVAQ